MAEDYSARLNEMPEGWLQAMGVTITLATKDEVRAELVTGTEHLQGYGIVHGGVHCGLIESLASIGAALFATPITRGQRTQVWEARVIDEEDRIVATGRVRLLCLEGDQSLAGEQVKGALHREQR